MIQYLQYLISFALGIIVGVVPKIIIRWWYRPVISIGDIDRADPYYSIFVRNTGRSTSINCEAMLTLNNIYPARDIIDITNATLHTNFFREIKDMNLSWARMSNGNLCSISIYPGARQLLNFFKVEKPDLNIVIASEDGWKHPRVCLKTQRGKEYKGEIKIFAENVVYNSKKHKKNFVISRIENDIELKFTDP